VDGLSVLGMAPDAQWIGCRNMLAGVGSPASYTACFEFFLAPFPQEGDPHLDGRPELAPDIINNSWGCPPSEGCTEPEILRQVVETARAAGQMVVASAGNRGPLCSTVVDPIAIYDATFTVGGYVAGGAAYYASSRGPVFIDGSMRAKPDLSAPGVNVFSSGPRGGYFSAQGTSMASPHVAGAVALLWSAVPALKGNVALTEQILLYSATPVAESSCLPAGSPGVPNAVFGHGRLNAHAAVRIVATGPSGGALTPYARLRVREPWSDAPRWVVPDGAGEATVPIYTLDWSGERAEPLTLTAGGASGATLVDSLGRPLLEVALFEASALLPVAFR
jgi:subtilisin family serine protease